MNKTLTAAQKTLGYRLGKSACKCNRFSGCAGRTRAWKYGPPVDGCCDVIHACAACAEIELRDWRVS